MFLATLTAVLAIMGNWISNPSSIAFWAFPGAILLLGLAYESAIAARAKVGLRISVPARCYLGRPALSRLEFRHALDRRLTLQVAPSAPIDFSKDPAVRRLSIAPHESASLELRLTPRRLGRHRWPPMTVRIAGALGLAWWSKEIKEDATVQVGPELLSGDWKAAGLGSAGARAGRGLGAGAELLQLRPYRSGDSPRVIDWKATARTRRLVSRDFAEDQHLEIVILIDAGRASGLRAGELDRFGHYVNAAARLAQYAVSLDDLVGLIIFSDRPLLELAPARGAPAIVRIRRSLSGARVEAAESNPVHAAVRVRSLVRHRSLVVLLTDLDDATVTGQLAWSVRLLLPKHLPFVAGLSSGAAEALARTTARRWLDPYRALAAQEYCTGLERKVLALRALGAPALVAKPDQLERAIFDAYASFRRSRRV